ncbi:hypothetical protein SPI_08697 [Niveomyces insectorum RCEF 264]|uniref:Inheritance of peroxisomes protein 1 n=1 Tax=Niveomyces insectorum RCEF 264 TaxID=1081102 RepID=A0A167MW69_9HYPO|nr:hypothetical protein SPI_08697 [Niveomyces insectorum RCEF 264]
MGAAKPAGDAASASAAAAATNIPATPRRASTAPLAHNHHQHRTSLASSEAGVSAATMAAAAAAAAEAAAAAAEFVGSPKSELSVASSTTATAATDTANLPPPPSTTQTTANGEAVETLYSHPAAKIISFTAGARNFALDNIGSTASRSRSRRSLTATTEEDIEPGTLPWSSQFDRTIAVGALSIYRAPGSVAFLSCGSALQPILPKSQCWCIDEESSKFILQIRRPQYWRIEVPVGDGGENDERARRLREVLDHILQFEKTPCPFKRAFTVALPEQPSTPLKKKPWTPVKRPETEAPSTPSPSQPKLHAEQKQQQQQQQQQQHERRSSSPPPPHLQEVPRAAPPPTTQPVEFTRREWAAMLESQKRGGGGAEEVDEFGRRLVPTLVAEHEQRIMDAKASEIEVNKLGTPWRNNSVSYESPGSGSGSGRSSSAAQRDRAQSLASDASAALRAAWPNMTVDRRWLEGLAADHPSDRSTADSSSPFNSLRSWLSSGKTPSSSAGSLASFPPQWRDDSNNNNNNGAVPPGLSSLYEDARRLFSNGGAATTTATDEPQQPPRIRHRATTSSISVSERAPLPPAVTLLAPHRHLRSLNGTGGSGPYSGRATTRLEAVRRIPGSIIYRVIEILLAPPSYLLALMLKIAARILSGEWRGFAVGRNTDTGERIPVQWDYTDVDDPLDRSTELVRRRREREAEADAEAEAAAAVARLRVYTEADDEVYTDNEDHHAIADGDGDGDSDSESDNDTGGEDDTERALSASPASTSKGRAGRAQAASSDTRSDADDSDTLSDAGGDPIVWTRRWAVD